MSELVAVGFAVTLFAVNVWLFVVCETMEDEALRKLALERFQDQACHQRLLNTWKEAKRMRKLILTSIVAAVAPLGLTFAISLGAGESQSLPDPKAAVLSLSEQHMAAGVMLPRGAYQVRCDHKGGAHEMVFRNVTRSSATGERIGNEVARVSCRMEQLERKATATTVRSRKDSAGQSTITEILVRGETVRHVLN